MSCVGLLILAWFLSLFGFDHVFIQGANELFGVRITIAGYYLIFFLVGLLFDLFGLGNRQ